MSFRLETNLKNESSCPPQMMTVGAVRLSPPRWKTADGASTMEEGGTGTEINLKLVNEWCERNQRPILDRLRHVLPQQGDLLEVGSGSGQHAAFLAENLPGWSWLPSDVAEENRASVRAWATEKGLSNLLQPIHLDVLEDRWDVGTFDALFSANLIHITPWPCCLGLLAGARRHVRRGGVLILYGPFRIGGEHTADSNAAFDVMIRGRDSRFGVRNFEDVCKAAVGFELQDRFEMPANNQLVVLRRDGDERSVREQV